eukprot:scaffold10948_cov132-Isochrysis_galbana.AAC.1
MPDNLLQLCLKLRHLADCALGGRHAMLRLALVCGHGFIGCAPQLLAAPVTDATAHSRAVGSASGARVAPSSARTAHQRAP